MSNLEDIVVRMVIDIPKKPSKAEDALKDSEERFRLLFETSPNGVIMQGLYGQILDCNDRFMKILGLSKKKIIGEAFIDICRIDEENRKKYLDNFQDMVNGEEVDPFEIKIINSAGNERYIEILPGLIKKDNVVIAAQSVVHDITYRKKREKYLRTQIELENSIKDILLNFINVRFEDLDKTIKKALGSIGKFISADRSYVFIYSMDGKTANNTHEWCAEGIEPQIDNLKGIEVKPYLWMDEKFKEEGYININNIDDIPSNSIERGIFEEQGIKSLLIIPIFMNDIMKGYVGFDCVKGKKIWSKHAVNLLTVVGEILFNALERKRIHVKLKESEKKLRSLYESMEEEGIRLHEVIYEKGKEKQHTKKESKTEEILIYECPLCGNQIEKTVKKCPNCGAEFEE